MGSDIDYMMLHARTRPSRITQKVSENIFFTKKKKKKINR